MMMFVGRCDDDPECELRARQGSQVFEVPSVTLNDIAHHVTDKFSSAGARKWIVKIDIEGQESRALTHEADDFFSSKQSNFQVPILFIEYRTALISHQLDRTRAMVRKFFEWGYCPYGYTAGMTGYYSLRTTYFENWSHDIILIKQPHACNSEFFDQNQRVILGFSHDDA